MNERIIILVLTLQKRKFVFRSHLPFQVLSAIPDVSRPETPPLYFLSMVPIEMKNSLYGRKLPEFQCGGSDPVVPPCIPDVQWTRQTVALLSHCRQKKKTSHEIN